MKSPKSSEGTKSMTLASVPIVVNFVLVHALVGCGLSGDDVVYR